MTEQIKYIPARLKSAVKGGHVTGSEDIDAGDGKTQQQVNNEVDDTLALHQSEINAVNRQNYVTVETYASLPATGEADTIYRVSSYDGTQVDATKYAEYAWNGSAYVLLDVKTQVGEVFDISEYKAVGGTLAKFADLAAALDSGDNVPVGVRKGGMSVKFVQSSDNKYVQARCMADSFTTDVTQWQGIDDVPTAGSDNLVKSGGVASQVKSVNDKIKVIEETTTTVGTGSWEINLDVNIKAEQKVKVLVKSTDASFVAGSAHIKGKTVGGSSYYDITSIVQTAIAFNTPIEFVSLSDFQSIQFYVYSSNTTTGGTIEFSVEYGGIEGQIGDDEQDIADVQSFVAQKTERIMYSEVGSALNMEILDSSLAGKTIQCIIESESNDISSGKYQYKHTNNIWYDIPNISTIVSGQGQDIVVPSTALGIRYRNANITEKAFYRYIIYVGGLYGEIKQLEVETAAAKIESDDLQELVANKTALSAISSSGTDVDMQILDSSYAGKIVRLLVETTLSGISNGHFDFKSSNGNWYTIPGQTTIVAGKYQDLIVPSSAIGIRFYVYRSNITESKSIRFLAYDGGLMADVIRLDNQFNTEIEGNIKPHLDETDAKQGLYYLPVDSFEVGNLYLSSGSISYGTSTTSVRTKQGKTIHLKPCRLFLGNQVQIRLITSIEGTLTQLFNFSNARFIDISLEGDYYVSITHRDGSAPTTIAEFLEDVYGAIKGSVYELALQNRRYAKLDNSAKSLFCIMSYNVGRWYNGSSTIPTPDADFDTYFALQKSIMERYMPDVALLQEYYPYTGGNMPAKESLLDDFFINSETFYDNNATYMGKAICSNKTQNGFVAVSYTGINDRNYLKGYVYLNGKKVCVVSTHWSGLANTTEAEQLIAALNGEDYVIVCADTNIDVRDTTSESYQAQLQKFVDAGYILANQNIITCTDRLSPTGETYAIDNIIYKGNITIKSIFADTQKSILNDPEANPPVYNSDHYPLIAYMEIL